MKINKKFIICYIVLYSLVVISFYGNDIFWIKLLPVSIRTFYAPGHDREMLRAIIKGNVEEIVYLVEFEGVDINQLERSNVMSFLKFAYLKKQKECFIKLLDYGAHPDFINYQRHVFTLSIRDSDPFYFETLLDYQQNFIDYVTAISGHVIYPSAFNQAESLRRYKLLYESGADPNLARPKWPVSPIESALYDQDYDRVLVLLKHGVLLNEKALGLIINPKIISYYPDSESQATREDVAAYLEQHYGIEIILEDISDGNTEEDLD